MPACMGYLVCSSVCACMPGICCVVVCMYAWGLEMCLRRIRGAAEQPKAVRHNSMQRTAEMPKLSNTSHGQTKR